MATPLFYINPPPPLLSGLPLLSSKKIRTPPVNQFSEGPTPFNNGQGGGGGFQLCRFLSNEIDIVRVTAKYYRLFRSIVPDNTSFSFGCEFILNLHWLGSCLVSKSWKNIPLKYLFFVMITSIYLSPIRFTNQK